MYSPATSTSPSISATDRPRSSTWVMPDSRGLVVRAGSFSRSFMAILQENECAYAASEFRSAPTVTMTWSGQFGGDAAARDALVGGGDRLDADAGLSPSKLGDRERVVLGARARSGRSRRSSLDNDWSAALPVAPCWNPLALSLSLTAAARLASDVPLSTATVTALRVDIDLRRGPLALVAGVIGRCASTVVAAPARARRILVRAAVIEHQHEHDHDRRDEQHTGGDHCAAPDASGSPWTSSCRSCAAADVTGCGCGVGARLP